MEKPRESFCDRRHSASVSRTGTTVAASHLQEKYDELDALVATQLDNPFTMQPSGSQAESNSKDETVSMQEFQTSIEQLCSRSVDLEQEKLDLSQKQTELKERREQQQQTLLSYQMHMEQLGNQLQAEISCRAPLQFKIEQSYKIGESLQNHCESVNQTVTQMLEDKTDLSNHVTQSINSFGNIKANALQVQDDFEEIRNLQRSIEEQRRRNQSLEAQFINNYNQKVKDHQDVMSKLTQSKTEMSVTLNEKKHQLKLVSKRKEDLLKERSKMAKKYEEESSDLASKLNIAEKNLKELKVVLEKSLGDKDTLSAKGNKISEETKIVIESVSALEKTQTEIEIKIEAINKDLIVKDQMGKDDALKLQRLRLKNSELKQNLEELRIKLNKSEADNSRKILQLEEKLKETKASASARLSDLNQDITSTKLNTSVKSQKCEEIKNTYSAKKEEYENLISAKENAVASSLSLKRALEKWNTDRENLSHEVQETIHQISVEKEKASKNEKMLQELKENTEKHSKLLHDEVEDVKSRVSLVNEALVEKETNLTMLAQKLQQIITDCEQNEKAANEKCSSSIRELEDKIEKLLTKKSLMYQENQSLSYDMLDQLNHQNDLLATKEIAIFEANSACEVLKKEVESHNNEIAITMKNIEMKKSMERELELKVQSLEREVHGIDEKLIESSSALQDVEKALQGKYEVMTQLELRIKTLEKTKTDTIAQNCEEKKTLLQDIALSKQTCETQSSSIAQLNKELDELKICYTRVQKESEAAQKLTKDSNDQTEKYNMQIEVKLKELSHLMKSFEKNQKRVRSANHETMSANRVYQSLCKGIAAAKAKKESQKASTSPKVSSRATVKAAPLEAVNEKEPTPHATLPSANKSQSYDSARKSAQDGDIASSSSTIVLEPQDTDEIEKNPGAYSVIALRKRADKTSKPT